jgi:hypothetical protein
MSTFYLLSKVKFFSKKSSPILLLSILLISFYLLPLSLLNDELYKSNCIHHLLFSRPCPGCGMTRATYHLFHFNITRAFNYNPSVLILPVVIFIEYLHILKKTSLIQNVRFVTYLFFCSSLLIVYLIRLF